MKLRDHVKEMMKDPEFVEEYKALEPEYEILEQLLSARAEKNMTQREPAGNSGIPQGHISRIENAPGVFLAGARYREDLSQRALAEMTGIPQRHISEMENGKRPVGKANARKLAEALNVDYRMFL